jgi:hypothetical protein
MMMEMMIAVNISFNNIIIYILDDSSEEKDGQLMKDHNYYRETHLNHFENDNNLERLLNDKKIFNDKLEAIKNKAIEMKFRQSSLILINEEIKPKIMWDNSSIFSNIKYCDVPRFLIVEVKINIFYKIG